MLSLATGGAWCLWKNQKENPPDSSLSPHLPINPCASFHYTANRSPSSSQNHENIFSPLNWTNCKQGKDIRVQKATAGKKSDAVHHVQQASSAQQANWESTVAKAGL